MNHFWKIRCNKQYDKEITLKIDKRTKLLKRNVVTGKHYQNSLSSSHSLKDNNISFEIFKQKIYFGGNLLEKYSHGRPIE